ncbi:MAG: hypothetical protein SGJ18_12320 [Pseudomonadota bacterium]|nr:hypothetical protein [Pseudomonadota bacterium]
MWRVEFESKKAHDEVEAYIRKGVVNHDDRMVISAWIRQVTLSGPESVRGQKRWDDHELENEWRGYRSSCYSRRGRIIYRIVDEIVKVKIARITPDHNYRKDIKK